MRAFRDEDNAARVAACFECCFDSKDTAQFAVRARFRRHGDAMHAGKFYQPNRQLVYHRQCALHGFNGLQRVDIGKALHARHFFIQPRVMLHGAAAQREEAQVYGVILTAEAGVMPHRFGFRQAGKANVAIAGQIAKARRDLRRIGQINARCSGRADFENQRLFQHQGFVAGICRGARFASTAHFGFPTALIDRAHANTSCNAAANVSTSSMVAASVTATTRPLASASTSGYKRPKETPPKTFRSAKARTMGRASFGSFSVNSLKNVSLTTSTPAICESRSAA